MSDEQRQHDTPADDALVATQYFAEAHGDEEAEIRAYSQGASNNEYELAKALSRYGLPPGDVGLSDAFPRRLVLVDGPGGSRVLLHSAGGPAGKSYHHALFYRGPVPTTLEAVSAWGSAKWGTESQQPSDQWPGLEGVPAGDVLVGSLVENLVSDKCTPGEPQDLQRVTIPERLAQVDEHVRRELLLCVATGVLLARSSGRRLVVNGEPGLVALLLYGAFRLLPEELVEGVTFSTYEPRSALTESHPALVVGTFASAETSLDGSEFGGGALFVDTVACRWSPELTNAVPEGLDSLVNAVATGKWGVVRAVHELYRLDEHPDASSLSRAVSVYGILRAPDLEQGIAAAIERRDDRLLQQAFARNVPSEWGPSAWLVRAATQSEELRQAFLPVLRSKHFLKYLRTEAGTRLYNDESTWLEPWRLFRQQISEQDQAKQFAYVIGQTDRPEVRDRSKCEVLKEWATIDGAPQAVPTEQLDLLSLQSADATRAMLDSAIPEGWKAQMLGLSFGSGCHADVRDLLVDGDESSVKAFCETFTLVEASAVDRFVVRTLDEVAERFRLPPKVVKRWHSARRYPLPGEKGRFDLYEIARWAEKSPPKDDVEQMPDWAKVRRDFEQEAARRELGEDVLSLVRSHPRDAAAMLSRLRRQGVDFAIPPEDLDAVLADAEIWTSEPAEDELEQLRLFTQFLPAEGRSLPALWKRPLDRLDKQLLLGDEEQQRLFAALYDLAREDKNAVPASARHELKVWRELQRGPVETSRPIHRPDRRAQWMLARPPWTVVAGAAFVAGLLLGGLSYTFFGSAEPAPSPDDESPTAAAASVVSGGK